MSTENTTPDENNLTNPTESQNNNLQNSVQDAINNVADSAGTNQAEPAETTSAPASDAAESKKVSAFQKRIDALTAEKWEERREKENLKKQTEALLEQIAEMRRSNNPASTPATSTTAAPNTSTAQPALSEAEIEARANARADELLRQKAFNKACNDVYEAGKDEFDDFDRSLKTFQMVGGLPTPLLETITEMPNSHKILYSIGKDAELAEKIVKMAPAKAALELARIEAGLSKPVSKQVSSAPAPVKPVDGSTRSNDDPEKMSTEEWIAWREKQLGKKR